MQSFGQKCFSTAPFLPRDPLHIILTSLKVLLSLLPSEESGYGGGGGWDSSLLLFYLFSSRVFIYRHFYLDEIVFFKGLCSRLSYGTVFLTVVMFGFICHQKGADGSKRSCKERNEQGFSAAKPVEIKINNILQVGPPVPRIHFFLVHFIGSFYLANQVGPQKITNKKQKQKNFKYTSKANKTCKQIRPLHGRLNRSTNLVKQDLRFAQGFVQRILKTIPNLRQRRKCTVSWQIYLPHSQNSTEKIGRERGSCTHRHVGVNATAHKGSTKANPPRYERHCKPVDMNTE